MGRKHFSTQTPQHSRHGRERERRRRGEVPESKVFGIRRALSPESSMKILLGLRGLQEAGDLPRRLQLEPVIYVPLLPLKVLGDQARKGLIGDYDVDEMQRKLRRRCSTADHDGIEADIKRVHVLRGTHVNISLVSPELEKERVVIAEELGKYGVKGLRRSNAERVLSMNVGFLPDMPHVEREQLAPGVTTLDERIGVEQQALQLVDEVHRVEIPVACQRWDIYPLQQAA